MKDKIKFNDAMLAAVINGRKTQTRRPMKVQPVLNGNWWEVYGAGWGKDSKSMPAVPCHSLANNCPYGRVGEIISVADNDGNIKGKIEITDVWLQQIQNIDDDSAELEGIKRHYDVVDVKCYGGESVEILGEFFTVDGAGNQFDRHMMHSNLHGSRFMVMKDGIIIRGCGLLNLKRWSDG